MNAHDRAILEHCLNGFNRLKPLLERIPRGTLYRHAGRLNELGYLERKSGHFRTTQEGTHHLETAMSSQQFDILEELYPPIQEIPTRTHKALANLTFAAIVCRQHQTRDDRHPFFVAAGRTFNWKTTLAQFICFAAGVDPGHHIVECGAETGRSLFVRKTGTGSIVYKRELLDKPLIVLDDYHTADPTVRKALQPILSGRMSVPLDNNQVTIRSVPFLTLNPGNHKELENRFGLSSAHIRRAVIANFDAVSMPDLAKIGDQAVKAVKLHGPICLRGPQNDCSPYLQQMVRLLRNILTPDAQERVDVSLLLNLATGMTAFIPDPRAAIAQVSYEFGILADTLGWGRSGWIQAVSDFTLSGEPRATNKSLSHNTGLVQRTNQNAYPDTVPQTIDLSTPKIHRDPSLPSLTLSNKLRSRLAWLEEETGRPTEELLHLLIDHYVKWQKDPATLATLYKILSLGRALELCEIDVDSVHRYLIAENKLDQIGCTPNDIPIAIRLLELLNRLPQPWTWEMARNAMVSVAFIIEAGVDLKNIRTFLSQYRMVSKYGLDLKLVVALDKAFSRAGLEGRRRAQAISDLVTGASLDVEIGELKIRRGKFQAEVQDQIDYLRSLELAINDAEDRLSGLRHQQKELTRELDDLKSECQRKTSHLEAFKGFERFLLERLTRNDPFWVYLDNLLTLHKKGEISPEQENMALRCSLFPKLVDFIHYIISKGDH